MSLRNIAVPKCIDKSLIVCGGDIQASTALDISDNAIFTQTTGTSVVDGRGVFVSNQTIPAIGYSFVMGGQAVGEPTQIYRFNVFGGMTHFQLLAKIRLNSFNIDNSSVKHEISVTISLKRGVSTPIYKAQFRAVPNGGLSAPPVVEIVSGQRNINLNGTLPSQLMPSLGTVDEATLEVTIRWFRFTGTEYINPIIGEPFAIGDSDWVGANDISLRLYREEC